VRLLHAVAFSKKLRWFETTKVITLKMPMHAVENDCRNSALSCIELFSTGVL